MVVLRQPFYLHDFEVLRVEFDLIQRDFRANIQDIDSFYNIILKIQINVR